MRKIALTLLCLVFISPLFAERIAIVEFGGMVDKISRDNLKDKFSTDMENVLTDDYSGSIVKSEGYSQFSSTSIYNGQSPKKAYRYKQVDGDEYMIAQASGTIKYTLGTSAFTTLLSTMNPSYLFDFTTAFNELIATNGSDDPWGFNGTSVTHYTVSNATNPKKARYVEFYNNRTFWGGVSSYRSTVYFSETGYAWNIGANNYININVNDGDVITGFKVSNGRFYVFKTRSMWEIIEDSPGNFRVVPISSEIGCLYQNSISHWFGFPVWMSHRGIELYNGTFELISDSKDHFFRGLNQLESGEYTWSNNSAGDWSNGTYGSTIMDVSDPLGQEPREDATDWNDCTCVDVDTTTALGSVRIAYETNGSSTNHALSGSASASHVYSGSASLMIDDDIDTAWWPGNVSQSPPVDIRGIVDLGESKRITSFTTRLFSRYQTDGAYYANPFYLQGSDDNTTWTAIETFTPSSEYTEDFTSADFAEDYRYYRLEVNKDGTHDYNGIQVREFRLWRDDFEVAIATITTQTLDYGFGATTFGYLISSETLPSGTSIDYATRSSTDDATYTAWSSTFSNGTLIPSSTGQYLEWRAQLNIALTSSTLSPVLHQVYVGGSWLSEVKDLTATPASYGSFSAVENNVDTDGTIDYYVRTGASTSTLASSSWTEQTLDTPVTCTAARYIQAKAELNMTSSTTIHTPPTLAAFSVLYYLSNVVDVIGINCEDRYLVSVSTRDDTSRNDVTMVYDKNGEWTRLSFGMSAATLYRNKLYSGDPTTGGLIFKQFVDGLYTYNGTAYESYWQSKLFDFGDPTKEKTYHPIWAIAKGEDTGSLSLDWRLDGIDTWSTGALNLNNSWGGVSVTKIPQPGFYKGRYIQYKISDDSLTTSWEFRKLIQDYIWEKPR